MLISKARYFTVPVRAPVWASTARHAPTPDAEPEADTLTEPVDIEAIVAAAVLIASGGDLEAAILDGSISETAAEAALQAIEDGTLGELLTGG